ncbi:MAG TPA: hypothetical protein VF174_10675 [Micromonosporaceae bacterium]
MNQEQRARRGVGVPRGAQQRTPRPGGRTVAQRPARPGVGVAARDAQDRGVRAFPVQGTAALRATVDERTVPSPQRTGDSAARPAPRLRVAPPPPVVRPRAPFVALILLLVAGGVTGILLVQTKVNENAFRLDQLRSQQTALDLEQQRLEKEIAEYEAPGNLAAAARKLGLVRSGPPEFIRLPDGRVVGLPQPAQGQRTDTSRQGG